jgi:hypothetical protein
MNPPRSLSPPSCAPRQAPPALTARVAEQVRAWSGLPMIGLGCVIGYRALMAGAAVAGLLLGTSLAGLGALRTYYLLRYLRSGNSR